MSFNAKTYEYDCTRKCRLRLHGNAITAALTKRSVDDAQLAAFIAKTCCNYMDIVDDLGRSAVHLAASVNRYVLLEWLLNQGAIINGRDFESGSSPLHRAIYYGCIDCAVLLLRYGASLELLDEDTRCALQNCCRLGDFTSKVSPSNELLVWGSNKNYNLGIDNESGSNTPLSLDYFRKEHISIEAVALGAYHSLFLDKKSVLYSVGHGKGGRLGIGNENSLSTPKKVKVPIKNASEVIICISASRNHSLLLTNQSTVFACGLNADKQLGVRDAGANLAVFKEVVSLRDYGVEGVRRVIAQDHHSLAYTDSCVYVWGANHGQFGMDANVPSVPIPKAIKLPARTAVAFVETNNAATVVYTKEKTILLYYNYKMKTLRTPNFEQLKSISVVGGDASKSAKGTATALKLLMLTETNVVFLWYEMTQNFYRCIFSQIRISQIDKIFYKANQVLILSQGDVYQGKCNQIPVTAPVGNESGKRGRDPINAWSRCDQSRTEISTDHMIRIDLQRFASIDRAVDIFCNDDFCSFAVLQESTMKYFKMPTLTPEEYTFKKLFNDVSDMDAVHDVVFHVDGEVYPAHKFIVYSRSPGLREIVSTYIDKDIYLNYAGLSGKMFELILKYIYMNYFPNEDDLDEIKQSLGPDCPADAISVCKLFCGFAEKFQLHNLSKYLKSFLEQQSEFYLPQVPDKSKYRFNRLRHQDYPALYDVRIICGGDVELPAHKCVLVARLEYFDMMFTHNWAEQTTINLGTVPVEYMQPILEFLYSSDVDYFRKQNFSESFLYNMIVFCDQFFIERLRKICELLILDKITVRKCGEMLDFACMYHCEVLQNGCMDFICQNLARVLMYKSLDHLEPDSLQCLNAHYRKMFQSVFDYRMITPDSEAMDDELLLSFVDDFEVDLQYRMDEQEVNQLKAAAKLNLRESRSKHDTRQHERDAISTMMKSISLNESTKSSGMERSKTIDETQEIAERLQAESKCWIKVTEKKEQKKKPAIVEHSSRVNDVLKLEESPKAEFVPLSKVTDSSRIAAKTPERDASAVEQDTLVSTPLKVYDLNFADLTASSREKLSQKQRKRLSSGSSSATSGTPIATWRSPAVVQPSKPVAVQPNAWGVMPQSPPGNLQGYSPPTGSSADPSSFANMIRGKSASPSTSAAGAAANATNNNSFTKILAEERKQRDYYDRQRNKSFALTQIEETAIAELRQFYNVDNVTDEIITIERKPMPTTMNFAVWQRN